MAAAKGAGWLVQAGFRVMGRWHPGDGGWVRHDGELSADPCVYAFADDEQTFYVGSAIRSFDRRMREYARARDLELSRPVHKWLRSKLAEGNEVRVLAHFVPNVIVPYDRLPLHLLIGIEAGLIAELDPEWNRRGRAAPNRAP